VDEVKSPKYLVGKTASQVWLIRTRNPFFMVNVSSGINAKGEISMAVWPPTITQTIPQTKFDRTLDTMVTVYLNEVGSDYSGAEEDITMNVFSSGQKPPASLHVFSKKSSWTGTLQIAQDVKLTSADGEEEVLA